MGAVNLADLVAALRTLADRREDESFLSDNELRTMTGYVQKSKQIKKLLEFGIPFYVDRSGRPKVYRSALEPREAKPRSARPDFEALRKLV